MLTFTVEELIQFLSNRTMTFFEGAKRSDDEDIVTSEPSNSFYNTWVCQTANATYHLYMGIADNE